MSPPPPPAPPPKPTPLLVKGDRLGEYEILETIGYGGMGVVYKAVDTRLGHFVGARDGSSARLALKVAIKVLTRIDEPELVVRFKREALAMARVPSKHVVKIWGVGETSLGQPYIVMELLHGEPLSSVLREVGTPMETERAVDIALGITQGLWACHRRGIIHRDVKPGNVFLHDEGDGETVKLLDLGISHHVHNHQVQHAPDDLTGQKAIGTLQYMSPEQALGRSIDERSDQFSLAVVLYTCLTGRLPWPPMEPIQHIHFHLEGRQFTPVTKYRPDLPATLVDVMGKAMAVEPAARFASVREFGLALGAFASRTGEAMHVMPLVRQSAQPTEDISLPNEMNAELFEVDTVPPPARVKPSLGAPVLGQPETASRMVGEQSSVSGREGPPGVVEATGAPTVGKPPMPGGAKPKAPRWARAAAVAAVVIAVPTTLWLTTLRPTTPTPGRALGQQPAPGPAGTTTATSAPPAPADAAWPKLNNAALAEHWYEQAVQHREAEEPEKAMEAIRQAHALSPSGKTMGQLGLIEGDLGMYPASQKHLLEALAADGDPWVIRNREALKQGLSVVRRRMAVSGADDRPAQPVKRRQRPHKAVDGVLVPD